MAGTEDNANGNAREDSDLFRKAMADIKVKPHHKSHHKPHHNKGHENPREAAPRPAVKIRKAQHTEPAPAGGVMTDKTDQGAFAEFARSGLQKKVLRRLKRGEYDFTATLDLHGHTIAEAEPRLTEFLRNATAAGNSAVLIIHGKGLRSGGAGGVLKRFTLGWLKQHPAVKAFCSALPRDGGTGAVYVLLRAGKRR